MAVTVSHDGGATAHTASIREDGSTTGVADAAAPAAGTGDAGGIPSTAHSGSGRLVPVGVAALGYLVAGFVGFWQSWAGGPTHTMTCGCYDPAQSAWFLSWTPFALLHGHNPFFSTWIALPHGVNLMDNASAPFLGLVAAPLTELFGPVLSWNVLALAALSGSALTAFLVFRRWAPWWPAAFAGGLFFGFGPYMVAEGANHLNLSVAVFPALTLWFVDSLVVRQDGNPYRRGALLGLLATAQLLTSSEILATTCVMSAIGLAVLALSSPSRTVEWLRGRSLWCARAVGTSTAVFAASSAYPLWMAFRGPQKVTSGEATNPDFLSANLLGFVLPSSNQLFTTRSTHSMVDPYFVGGYLAENATYVGIAVLAAVAAVAVWQWRHPIVRVATVGFVAAAIFSLGSRLTVATHKYPGVGLPYHWLSRLPEMANAIPARFGLYVDLFTGLLLAVGLDRLRAALLRRRRLAIGLPIVVGGLLLATQAPAWPYAMPDTAVPPYFTSDAVRDIPEGAVVDVYPFPRVTQAQAMLWQAESGMRFRMLGGFVLTPDARGRGTEFPAKPEVTEIWFGSTYWLPGPARVVDSAVAGIRADLRSHHVAAVLVAKVGTDPQGARTLISASIGPPSRATGGVWAWYGVQDRLRKNR